MDFAPSASWNSRSITHLANYPSRSLPMISSNESWKKALLIVLPDTVVRWHRSGFKLYWAMLCKVGKPVGGGRRISKQIRELIFQMVADNPSWGAPRIHGELLMLGFDVSETTISRWMKRAPKDPQPAKRWLAFLRNHQEAIAAMDFFTVPTLT